MMLRRTFLKLFGSAAVAFAVGVHHFKPIPDEILLPLDKGKEEIVGKLSPVLEAIVAWNEDRWRNHGGVLLETEANCVPIKSRKFETSKSAESWRTRWAAEMAAMSKEEFTRLADNSKATLPGETLPEPVDGRGPIRESFRFAKMPSGFF